MSDLSNLTFEKRIKRKAARMRVPYDGAFELTPRCTMRCKMCYIVMSEEEQKKAGKELTAEQWIDLAEQGAKVGLSNLLITGGEPFIRPDFYEILGGIAPLGIVTRINTNATLIDEKAIEKLLKTAPVRFNVSLYGTSNETYEKLCGYRGGFDKVSRAIDLMIDAGFNVKLNFTLTHYNEHEAAAAKRFAEERNIPLQCTNHLFTPINNSDSGIDDSRLDAKSSAEIFFDTDCYRMSREACLRDARQLKMTLEMQKSGELEYKKKERMTCSAGKNSFWIAWDGKMYPCGLMRVNGVEPLEVGFKSAWDHTVKHAEDVLMPKECSNCEYARFCHVCAAQIMCETGDSTKIDLKLCEATKINAKMLLEYLDREENS